MLIYRLLPHIFTSDKICMHMLKAIKETMTDWCIHLLLAHWITGIPSCVIFQRTSQVDVTEIIIKNSPFAFPLTFGYKFHIVLYFIIWNGDFIAFHFQATWKKVIFKTNKQLFSFYLVHVKWNKLWTCWQYLLLTIRISIL